MANPRFAPEFRVAIDGRPVPAAMRASITGVRWESGLEGADRVELTLANTALRWLDESLLGVDRELELFVGYAPDPLERVFSGPVVGRSATFPAEGMPTLTVAAQDRMERLMRGERVRWFAIPIPSIGNFPLPDMAVGGIMAAENELIPIFEPVGAALSVLLGGAEAVAALDSPGGIQKVIRKQEGQSDFDFLSSIAAENGWELMVDHSGPLGGHQLRFFSALDHLTPDLTLGYGRSLLEFTPRVTTVGQLVSVTAYVWVAAAKTSFEVTVGWDWDRMSLTIDVRPVTDFTGSGPSEFLIGEPVTPVSAPRAILSELIPKLNRRLTGGGSTVGDPRLKPGAVVRLEGLGEEFGGLYRVTTATHTIDGGGYRTTFQARKEIWFGSIPLADQGAVPVRLQGRRVA